MKLKFFLVSAILICTYNNLPAYTKAAQYFPKMKQEHFAAVSDEFADRKHIIYFLSVLQYESRFNERAFNGHDYGIAQINECHKNAEQYMDWRKGIKKGAYEFKANIAKANGDMAKAVAMYNAGRNANLAKYKGWRTYVMKVCFKAADMENIKI